MTRSLFIMCLALAACAPRPGATPPGAPSAASADATTARSSTGSRPVFLDLLGADGFVDHGLVGTPEGFGFEPRDAEVKPLLVYDGVRPPSRSVLAGIEPFLATRSAKLVSYQPNKQRMLVITNLGATRQVHMVKRPLGTREQLTFGHQSVKQAKFDPLDANALLLSADVGGTERYAVLQHNLLTGQQRPISPPNAHATAFVSRGNGDMAISLLTDGGRRTRIVLLRTGSKTPKTVLDEPGRWFLSRFSPDGKQFIVKRVRAADEQMLYFVDLERGSHSPLEQPRPGLVYRSAIFSQDAKLLYVAAARRGSDFVTLWAHSFADKS